MAKTLEKKKPKKIFVVIKLLIILLLIGGNTFLIINLHNKKKTNNDNTNTIEVNNDSQEEIELSSTWRSDSKIFKFTNNNFTFYDNAIDYYEGTYTYLKGEEALEEMGYTEEDLKDQFGEGINKENVYSMKWTPTKRFINKEDKSKIIKEGTTWWFILVIKDKETAIGYNKTLETKYELKKVVDE